MAAKESRRREPTRERRRSKETICEAPIKVSIATTPQSGGADRRPLDQNVELTKAALLYADEVEIVSLSAAMFDELRQVVDAGELGGFGLIASLDDETIAYLAGGRTVPPDWRETVGKALSVNPDLVDALGIEGADTLRELQEAAAATGRRAQQDMTTILEESGATELVTAAKAGALKVADLGFSSSITLRPTDLDPGDTTGADVELDRRIGHTPD